MMNDKGNDDGRLYETFYRNQIIVYRTSSQLARQSADGATACSRPTAAVNTVIQDTVIRNRYLAGATVSYSIPECPSPLDGIPNLYLAKLQCPNPLIAYYFNGIPDRYPDQATVS